MSGSKPGQIMSRDRVWSIWSHGEVQHEGSKRLAVGQRFKSEVSLVKSCGHIMLSWAWRRHSRGVMSEVNVRCRLGIGSNPGHGLTKVRYESLVIGENNVASITPPPGIGYGQVTGCWCYYRGPLK